MVLMGTIMMAVVLGVGVLFLRIHTLPDRIAHKGNKLQFEIVAVLGLLALFTNVHLFWVIGLLLALVDIPDFRRAFGRMARAPERIAPPVSNEPASREPGTAASPDVATRPSLSTH